MNRLLFFLLLIPLLARAQTDPQLVLNTGGHQSAIRDLAVTRDGKTILSAGYDKVIRIWNAQTGQLMDEIRGQQTDGYEGMIYVMLKTQ